MMKTKGYAIKARGLDGNDTIKPSCYGVKEDTSWLMLVERQQQLAQNRIEAYIITGLR